MATATIPETVTLPTEVVLETLAVLDALGSFDQLLEGLRIGGKHGIDTSVGHWCFSRATELRQAAFGSDPHEDDWIVYVETENRIDAKIVSLLECREHDNGWVLRERAQWFRDRVAAEVPA
jgi:hypothetical protein